MSRYTNGGADGSPGTENPLFAEAQTRTEKFAGGGQTWADPRGMGELPDVYISMGHTQPRNVAQERGVSRADQDAFAVRSQNLAQDAIANGFWAARSRRSRCLTARSSLQTTAREQA